VLTLMVATRGMRVSEGKRPMKSWRTMSYTGSVTRHKPVSGQLPLADNWRVDTMGCLGNRAGSPFHGSFTCSALPSSSERQT
jgi:hypothetical protein